MIDTNVRILVAGNDAGTSLVGNLLTTLGFRNVACVIDGGQAWSALREGLTKGKPFSLLISELDLPNINGVALLKRVRSHEDTRDVPFLFLSGLDEQRQVLPLVVFALTSYVTKPINPGVMESKLKEMLLHGENKILQQKAS